MRKIEVNPNNPKNMFEDSELIGKVLSVKYDHSYPQEYLVCSKSHTENSIGLKMALVIRRNPIIPNCIDALTAEFLPDKPLHFCLVESVHKGDPNHTFYEKKLKEAIM